MANMSANGPRGMQRRRRGQGVEGRPLRGPDAARLTAVAPGAGLGEHKRSLIETALLITLIEESGHGYALVERVQQLVGDQLRVDAGSIYRVLRTLEETGMISSAWEPSAAGPLRRTYTVEPPGRELLRSWADFLEQRGDTLLRLSGLARERLD